MRVKLNFNMEAWIDGIEIDAESIEEAKEKLGKMTLNEIADECDDRYYNSGVVKEVSISDVDAEISEATYKVRAYDIIYDVTAYDVDDGTLSDQEIEDKIIKVQNSLPKELIVTVTCEPADLEDYVSDEISDITNWLTAGFKYDILEEK